MLNIFRYKRGRKYMTGYRKTKAQGFIPARKHPKRPRWKRRRKKNRKTIKHRIDAKRFRREVKRKQRRKRLNHNYLMRSLFGSSYVEGVLPTGGRR